VVAEPAPEGDVVAETHVDAEPDEDTVWLTGETPTVDTHPSEGGHRAEP
jgi:hypothetical protein